MAIKPLPNELKRAGQELLAQLDDLGLLPQAAAWIYAHDLGDWRYYVASSLVDIKGRKWVYGKLLDAFDVIDLPPGLTIFDVHLASPRDPMFGAISGAIEVTGRSDVTLTNCNFNGVLLDAVLYRFSTSIPKKPQTAQARQFERKIKKVLQGAQD